MRRGFWGALAGVVYLFSSAASGQSVPAAGDAGAETALGRLKRQAPRAKAYHQGQRITRLYGAALSTAPTAEDSAERFRQNHAAVFGVTPQELVPSGGQHDGVSGQPLMYDPATGKYKFTLFKYAQQRNGIPVFRADLRLLVRNATDFPLVLASSGVRQLEGFEVGVRLQANLRQADFVAAGFAAAKREALRAIPDLANFTEPQIVVWAGLNDEVVKPRVALMFVADNFAPGGQSDQKRLYLADVETAQILHEESAIIDVDGSAAGMATTGSGADFCEAEVSTVLPHLRVSSGGNSTFTDTNGNFTVAAGGGTVDATLNDGQWFDVFNFVGSVESLSLPASTPADFVFNSANSTEEVRAQANGYVEANVVRDFAARFNPSYPTFTDTDIPCTVNRTDGFCPGNAWYDPADGSSPTGYSINFCLSGGGSPNTAWSSVIHHEFGHHLVQAAGSGQGQYGEGMGDVLSVVILDDNRVGLGFFGTCDLAGTLRNAENTIQYPCSGEIHFCGQLIAGCVWDTRNELVVTEPASYTDILGNLAVNSILLHTGDLITPQITIDWLTLDDDDGNIGNGTPHYTEICTGFGAHNMDCPPLDVGMSVAPTADFEASGDPGGPFTPNSAVYTVENLGPGSISYSVTTTASWLTITNGSGSLPNVGDTAQVTIALNAGAASLPQGRFEETVNFLNTTDGVGDTVRFARLNIGIPDNCAAAIPICPGSFSDSTVNMTNDGSATCGTSNSTPDMWFSYTPESDGTATMSLCTGTAYDSVLSIHSGCPGTSGNELACDDDFCSAGGPSQVTLAVTAGTTYLIRVTGWNGSTGSFTLTLTGPNCASSALSISFPNGLPATLLPGIPTTFDVRIQDGDESYVPGSGTLHYRYDGGAFLTAPLTSLGGDLFEATLPVAGCLDTPEFYISAQGNLGTTVLSPGDAPTSVYSALVGTLTTIMDDDFETDQGWTVGDAGDNATTGIWDRADPEGTAAQPENDNTAAPGTTCWVTDSRAGASLGTWDVDNGKTTLKSPVVDLSGLSDATVSYYRWYSNDTGATPNTDVFVVDISNDGGGSWTNVETVGPSGSETSGGWIFHAFQVADFVTPTNQVMMRFVASDEGSGSLVEAAVDDFLITALDCTSTATCFDGILNQGEDRIDCGGPCPPCACLSDGACDDGQFCTGTETCDAFGVCQPGTNPCAGTEWCKEAAAACIAYGTGDFEPDGDLDLNDFLWFQQCFGQLADPPCEPGNLNGDGMIDSGDLAEFVNGLTGPQ